MRNPNAMKRTREPRQGERGGAMIIAILVILVLTTIGLSLMIITDTEQNISKYDRNVKTAFFVAEAGIRVARGILGEAGSAKWDEELCWNPSDAVCNHHSTDSSADIPPNPWNARGLEYRGMVLSEDAENHTGHVYREALTDDNGNTIGYYTVWVRDNAGDGTYPENAADSPDPDMDMEDDQDLIITIISEGIVVKAGQSPLVDSNILARKVLAVDVRDCQEREVAYDPHGTNTVYVSSDEVPCV